MSHFSVAVFSDGKKTVKELLAPYQENNMGDCPKKYLKFVSAVEKEHERYETGSMNIVCLQDGKYVFPWNIVELKSIFSYTIFTDGADHSHFYKNRKEYFFNYTYDPILGHVQIVFDIGEKNAELRSVPYREIYPTIQDYLENYFVSPWDIEKQEFGFWENPNAKWDWWQIGGRWNGLLKASEGIKGEDSLVYPTPDLEGRYAQARVKDINFEPDCEIYNRSLRWWEVVIENSPLKDGENADDFFNTLNEKFLLGTYKNKETYAKIQSSVITNAVILPEGKWYQAYDIKEAGAGYGAEEKIFDWNLHFKERFIDKAEPEWVLTIVDCHI